MVHNLTPEVFTCLHPFLSAGYMNTSIPYTFSLFNPAWNNYCIVPMVTLLCTAQKAHVWGLFDQNIASHFILICLRSSERASKKMHLLTGLPHNGKSVEDNPSGLPIDPTSIVWTSWIQPKKQAKKLSCSVSLGVPIWGGIGLCFTKNVCMYLSPAFTCPFLKIASEFIIWVLLI